MLEIKRDGYSVSFDNGQHTLSVLGGRFGEMKISPAPLFFARAKRVSDGKGISFSSADRWGRVTVSGDGKEYYFKLEDPCEISGISVEYKAEVSDLGIFWSGSVTNRSREWSVMEITYPVLNVGRETFDLFLPVTSGIVIKDAGRRGYAYTGEPAFSMQFFAAYGNGDGVYLGIHDPNPVIKRYDVTSSDGKARFLIYMIGEGGSLAGNSFSLAGKCVWRVLRGDWFDAAKIYSEFVKAEARWLPEIKEDGRVDTPREFKEIPFWVCDYIPNTVSQGNNKPMKLSAGSDIYTKGYWYNAVIELQKILDVPIAYHVYNWHSIPFNVNYPHFLPAKDEFEVGLAELKKHGISVFPYINALSWETRDNFDEKFDVTFENTGEALAVKLEDGSISTAPYPQTHNDGKSVLLARICPTTKRWQSIIKDVVSEMESTLDIDGIYFDQVSAGHGRPCYDPTHGHALGGGSFWCDGYREFMTNIIKDKPEGSFYFSEDNTEQFMNLFDGFLTWRWLMNEEVPAFPAVYAGYIQMLGRNVLGEKKEDVEFFKHTLAKSFVYGQQLGWIKADVIYSKEKLPLLKTLVRERYRHAETFIRSEMLRPPKVISSLPPKVTSPAMFFTSEVVMEQVYAGAWKYRSGGKTVIFVINIAKEECEYTLSFDSREYGVDEAALLERGFALDGDKVAKITEKIAPESITVFEF